MLFELIKEKVGQQGMLILEEDINKDKVECVPSHHSNETFSYGEHPY